MIFKVATLKFKINGRGDVYFFVSFAVPPTAYFYRPPFINFLYFTRDYKEIRKYIIDS